MPTDTTDLMGKIYDFFSSIYAASSTDKAFLAFEPLGIPITDAMFKMDQSDTTLSAPLAVERLSEIANRVLIVQNNQISHAMNTVDGTVNLMATASSPATAEDMASLGAAKTEARTKYGIEIGSMSGIPDDSFHPVMASPVDWYVSTATADWTAHTEGQQQAQGTPPPPPPPPRRIPIDPPVWRVLPERLQPIVLEPAPKVHPILNAALLNQLEAPPVVSPIAAPIGIAPTPIPKHVVNLGAARSAMSLMSSASAEAAGPAVAAEASHVQLSSTVEAAPAPTFVRQLQLTQVVAALNTNATPQPVATENVTVSFEHCIVGLSRPWLSDTLFMLRNWFIPGYARGEISKGTGPGDSGLMPILTTGFVAVRNLNISAQWSAQDIDAIQRSASFGPFSLVGRTFDTATGTLACKGIQIIGWFCATLPVLPPVADPALPAPASPADGSGTGNTNAGGTADTTGNSATPIVS